MPLRKLIKCSSHYDVLAFGHLAQILFFFLACLCLCVLCGLRIKAAFSLRISKLHYQPRRQIQEGKWAGNLFLLQYLAGRCLIPITLEVNQI